MILAIPSSGVARVSVTSRIIGEVNGFPVRQNTYGEVVNLPDPEEGTVFVVSALVAQAAKDRKDLLVVDDTVRNEKGQIIGCRGFARV
ncbi:MAG: hypothetical protein WAP91_02885 [Bacilli bacterium]